MREKYVQPRERMSGCVWNIPSLFITPDVSRVVKKWEGEARSFPTGKGLHEKSLHKNGETVQGIHNGLKEK